MGHTHTHNNVLDCTDLYCNFYKTILLITHIVDISNLVYSNYFLITHNKPT